MTLDPKLSAYVQAVVRSFKQVLGEGLIGAYLHGSAALGGFDSARSDVDILAVCSRPLAAEEKRALIERLSEDVLPCPAGGLEMSVVTEDAVREATRCPRFELHVGTKRWKTVVDGTTHEGDADLVLHFAVCREYGLALFGPLPEMLFPILPRAWMLEQMADEMRWAEEHADWGSGILNACRNLRFMEDGIIGSKDDGAEWAVHRGFEPVLVTTALALRRGEGRDPLDAEAARSLLRRARSTLGAAAHDAEGKE